LEHKEIKEEKAIEVYLKGVINGKSGFAGIGVYWGIDNPL